MKITRKQAEKNLVEKLETSKPEHDEDTACFEHWAHLEDALKSVRAGDADWHEQYCDALGVSG